MKINIKFEDFNLFKKYLLNQTQQEAMTNVSKRLQIKKKFILIHKL